MNKEELFQLMNEIDDDLLNQSEKKHIGIFKNKKMIGFGVLVLSCLLLAIGLNHSLNDPQPSNKNPLVSDIEPNQPFNPNLPILSLYFENESMGYEAVSFHDISDILSPNSWNETMIYTTLPVYKNELNVDLKEVLTKYAKKLGMNMNENQIEIIASDTEFNYQTFQAEDENYIIEVSGSRKEDVRTAIYLKKPYQLSEKYNNSFHGTYTQREDIAKLFKDKITDIADFKNPQIVLTGGGFDIYDRQQYDAYIVEGQNGIYDNFSKNVLISGSVFKNTVTSFYITEQKDMEKIADYPTISIDKAKQLLLRGKYYSSAPKPKLTEDNILKVEMTYRGGHYSDIVIPYYRFLMKIDDWTNDPSIIQNGADCAGYYYVPAIEDQYLDNNNYWQGKNNQGF